MSTRPATDPTTDWRATVAVRVPRNGDGTLAECASRRLAAREGIDSADVVAVQAVEPALAATVVRLAVRLTVGACLDAAAVEARIADAPGVQRVDELRRA